jgi:hypothetical protein
MRACSGRCSRTPLGRATKVAGLLSLAVALVGVGRAGAASTGVVRLLGSSDVEIHPQASTATFSLAFRTVAPVAPSAVQATVLQVSTGGRVQAGLASRFVVTATDAPIPHVGYLVTHLRLNPPLRPGIYDVLARITCRTRRQALTYKLTVPVATLRPAETVDAKIVKRWPFHDEVTAGTLVLSERSHDSQLTRLSVVTLDAREPDGDASDGRLVASDVPQRIGPGGTQTVHLRPSGRFALGKTTGTVAISAPQLDAPVEASFEVVRQMDPLYILVVALLGLLLGKGTLAWLGRFVDRGHALDAAFALLGRIDGERSRSPDATLTERLGELRSTLEAATKKKADEIAKATTDAADGLDEALKQYDERLDAAAARLAALRRVAEDGRPMPSFAAAARSRAAESLDAAAAHLHAGDATSAVADATRIEEELAQALREGFGAWAAAQDEALDVLDSLGLSKADLGRRDALSEAARAALRQPSDDATAEQLIDDIVAAAAALRELSGWMLALERVATEALNILRSTPQSSTPEVAELDHALDALDEARTAAARDPSLSIGDVAYAAEAVDRALLPAIVSVAPLGADAEVTKAYEDDGARTAASLARTKKRDALGVRGVRAAGGDEGWTLRTVPAVDEGGVVGAVAVTQYVLVRSSARTPVARQRRRARAMTTMASVIRFLLIAGAVLALSYILFSSDWTGTWSDVAKVFLWAWGLDLAAESVAGQAERLAPSTS